jgi:hypothetical protein
MTPGTIEAAPRECGLWMRVPRMLRDIIRARRLHCRQEEYFPGAGRLTQLVECFFYTEVVGGSSPSVLMGEL